MKRLLFFAALLALLSGCAQSDGVNDRMPVAVDTPETLYAEFADERGEDETRTYVVEERKLRWHEGDEISFFPVTYNMCYRFNGQTGDNGGSFSKVTTDLVTGNSLPTRYAVYPYQGDTKINEFGHITYYFPEEQQWAEESFGRGANAMVAVTENHDDNVLRFKNVGGYLKLQLYSSEERRIDYIELEGNNGERIVGEARIESSYDWDPWVEMTENAGTRVTLDCFDYDTWEDIRLSNDAENPTDFWIVLPPTYFDNGITVRIYDTEGNVCTKSTNNWIPIDRNCIQPLSTFEFVADGGDNSDEVTEVVAPYLLGQYYNVVDMNNHNYYIRLANVDGGDMDTIDGVGICYYLDIYSDEINDELTVPNGVYMFDPDNTHASGTFAAEYGYAVELDEEGNQTWYEYAEGSQVTVMDDMIVAELIMQDGTKHVVTYEGSTSLAGNGGEEERELSSWTVIGAMTEWGEDIPMYIYENFCVAYDVYALAGDEFKFRKDGEWENNYGGELMGFGQYSKAMSTGENIIIPEEGNYDIYFDPAAEVFFVMFAGEVPSYTPMWSIIGSFNDWSNDIAMEKVDGYNRYMAYGVEVGDKAEFKFRLDGAWDTSYGGELVGIGEASKLVLNGNNIVIPEGGFYNFLLELDTMQFTVMPCESGEVDLGSIAIEVEQHGWVDDMYSATFHIYPEAQDAYYIVMSGLEEIVSEFDSDDAVHADSHAYFEYIAQFYGISALDCMRQEALIGQSSKDFNGTIPGNYVAYAYYIDYETGERLSDIHYYSFTIEEPGFVAKFAVDYEVAGNKATFHVVPSNEDYRWFSYCLSTDVYDHYIDQLGGDKELLLAALNKEVRDLRNQGLSDERIISFLFAQGEQNRSYEGLTANTEHVFMVAAVDNHTDLDNVTLSNVTNVRFVTGDALASDMTFDISVTDITATHAAIKITPSNEEETFCWIVGQWDGVQTAQEIMDSTVAAYKDYLDLGYMLYSGIQDYTGGEGSPYKYKLDAPDTDYYVIAFGYSGGVTTAPQMVTFRSLPGEDINTIEFTMETTDVQPTYAKLKVTPSAETVYYTFGLMRAEEWNEEYEVQQFNAQFDELLDGTLSYDPNATVANVLSSYFIRGTHEMAATSLDPNSVYMAYLFVLDNATGHVARVITYPEIVTTPDFGAATPTLEVLGIFSGDEEAGSIFAVPSATAGKAIIALKIGNLDAAESYYYGSLVGDNRSFDVFSDASLLQKKTSPYIFLTCDWGDTGVTSFAAAKDANGIYGEVTSLYVQCDPANVDPIGLLEEIFYEASNQQ